jgi:polyhydroxybutyrate depolymerase
MPSALLAQSEQATHVIMVQVGDAYRSVQLHIPAGHNGKAPLPLVFNLHGSGGTAERQELLSGMSTVADENQFFVAGGMAVYEYPEGRVTWNADLDPNGVSDVDYIRAAIDAIDRKVKVDRKRVFVTGMSGGGRMSSRIGCELADVIAAVAPVAGVQFGAGCNPVRAIPLITFHALDDNTNKYFEGNKERNPNWVAGIEGALESWASNNECDTAPKSTMITEDVTRISHKDCKDGADIVLYQTRSGGHSWPGTPIAKAFKERGRTAPNMDINASRMIWKFFEAHPLP